MESAPQTTDSKPPDRSKSFRAAIEVVLIFALFFIHAGWPVPDVNETHYLPKAKHYWNPDWCARDFFLTSADAHQVFYWTFGWLTRFLSLPATAWCGRLITWALLAWAWRRLSVLILPKFLYSVLSAGLFVAAISRANLAGEWVVGGFEAKGIAYVFVLLALEAIVRDRWRAVWPLLGVASSFHVLVGGWSVLMAGFVWPVATLAKPPLRSMLPSLALGLLLALPGLVPAIALTWGADPAVVREANRIYVFERLPHHLDPFAFPEQAIVRHLLLIALWATLCCLTPTEPGERRIRWFVGTAIGIVAIGFVIASLTYQYKASEASFMRYYWFRMSDAMVPLGVALLAIRYIDRQRQLVPVIGDFWLLAAMLLAGSHFGEVMYRRQHNPNPPADARLTDPAGWREICAWIEANTPADALFITPRGGQSFRWYAHRAELVDRKDIPQDANSIVLWWQRINDLFPGLSITMTNLPIEIDHGSDRLKRVAEKYGAGYVVTPSQPTLALEQVNPPGMPYAVYRIPRSP